MREKIQSLMDLQEIDLQIQSLDNELTTGLEQLEKRKATITNCRKNLTEYSESLITGQKRHNELETQIEDDTAKLKEQQTKLMNIQTNREYQSILKEIEDTKQLNKQREDELILLMEQTESIKNKVEELSGHCEQEEKYLSDKKEKMAQLAKMLEEQKIKIGKSRIKQAKKVDNKYLNRYDKLREKRNGLAMAGVTNGVCRGCNMNIPPQLFNELLREEQLLSCPTCNRMMFHKPATESE